MMSRSTVAVEIARTPVVLAGKNDQLDWTLVELASLVAENTALVGRVAELRRELIEARRAASHDELTGLPNRKLLADRLGQALALAQRNGQRVAVLMLDIDHFKEINDRFGHAGGDAVLREVARRLAAAVRASDTSSRVGGDEFVVVLADVAEHGGTDAAVAKILAALSAPHLLDGRRLAVSASVGLATFPDDAGSAPDLIRRADLAMYRTKSRRARPLLLASSSLSSPGVLTDLPMPPTVQKVTSESRPNA